MKVRYFAIAADALDCRTVRGRRAPLLGMKRSESRFWSRGREAIALAAWLISASAGCQLFSDLDRFEQLPESDRDAGDRGRDAGAADGGTDAGADGGAQPPDLGCDNPRTLCVRVERFSPHVDELVTVDLVTVQDNILRSRAIIEPMGGVAADFVLPLAIPAREVPEPDASHPLQVEIFADQNQDGMYTPGGSDHEWNVELPPSGNLAFPHNSEFTSIDPRPREIGGDFRMQFFDMTPHLGQLLEVMVIEVESGRTVGMYRTPSLEGGDFEITIPGIIDPGGIVYRVEFYADLNDNGSYDDPPVDHTWVIPFVESGADGVDAEFRHGTDFADLEYQFDFEE